MKFTACSSHLGVLEFLPVVSKHTRLIAVFLCLAGAGCRAYGRYFIFGGRNEKKYIAKIFLMVFTPFFIYGATYAGESELSVVAIAPDSELCFGADGLFLPLPDVNSYEASYDFINSAIDRKFGKECKLNGLLIKGKISEKTLPQFRLGLQLLKARRNNQSVRSNTLWLDSPGGLIAEAIKIGDVIAEEEMDAIVVFDGYCYSACVFIYAAAKTRSGTGDIGIHRPFASEISADSMSYSEYLEEYDALTPVLKRYFAKYGVSPSLVDSMNIVSSDEIRVMSDQERDSYGLGFNNIAAKEHAKARTLQICGKEYYEMHIGFHALIQSCRKRFGIDVLDEKNEECLALARQEFPDYSNLFDVCKARKADR